MSYSELTNDRSSLQSAQFYSNSFCDVCCQKIEEEEEEQYVASLINYGQCSFIYQDRRLLPLPEKNTMTKGTHNPI